METIEKFISYFGPASGMAVAALIGLLVLGVILVHELQLRRSRKSR